MRVPQEKREPYPIHFVSANKHPTVYHRYVGKLIPYNVLHKYLRYAFVSYSCKFPKYAKFLARSILFIYLNYLN